MITFIILTTFGGIAAYINSEKNRGNEFWAFMGGFLFGIFGILWQVFADKKINREKN